MIICAIFLFGFLYFVLVIPILQIQTSTANMMTAYGSDVTYDAWGYADTFMTNLWQYMLVIVLVGVIYWAWTYSQRKNLGG